MSSSVTERRFREVFNTLEPWIERRYGIPVVVSDVPNPFTGDLDGASIHVDYDLSTEEAVFVIAHLFGHTVQWNVNPRYREIGLRGVLERPSEAEIAELSVYEREACRYSMALLHQVGVRDLDAWLSDFAACDLAYLLHFYRSGEKRPFHSFMRPGQTRLAPLEIPDFRPTRWMSRWEGIVI